MSAVWTGVGITTVPKPKLGFVLKATTSLEVIRELVIIDELVRSDI